MIFLPLFLWIPTAVGVDVRFYFIDYIGTIVLNIWNVIVADLYHRYLYNLDTGKESGDLIVLADGTTRPRGGEHQGGVRRSSISADAVAMAANELLSSSEGKLSRENLQTERQAQSHATIPRFATRRLDRQPRCRSRHCGSTWRVISCEDGKALNCDVRRHLWRRICDGLSSVDEITGAERLPSVRTR